MRNIKKMAIMAVMVLSLVTVSVSVFAKGNSSPAETVAGVTNKTTEAVEAEKAAGKSYGQIAIDADKLEEFKLERAKVRKDNLADKVAEGKITQAEADEFSAKIEARQADCDGSGLGRDSEDKGLRLHQQNGEGLNHGNGQGTGQRLQEKTGSKVTD